MPKTSFLEYKNMTRMTKASVQLLSILCTYMNCFTLGLEVQMGKDMSPIADDRQVNKTVAWCMTSMF